MTTVSIPIEVTDEIRDAIRQAGLEGRLAHWAQDVLQVEAERIVFGPKRIEVRPATDAEQASALHEAAANLGPPFSIRLTWSDPERPCAMMPIAFERQGGPDLNRTIDRAWTDETGTLTLPRNSKALMSIRSIHVGGLAPIPFNVPKEGDMFTLNLGPRRPRGYAP